MSSTKPLTLPSTTSAPIPSDTRNNIYSALLSGTGIRTIEATLEHELQASGWIADLKAYMTSLLRSGECTTVAELNDRVLERVRTGAPGTTGARSASPNSSRDRDEGTPEKGNGNMNGNMNGNAVNGHGTSNGNAHADPADFDLRIPERAVREGVRVVRRELEKVCEITVEGDDK
ncbi:hypothetical protein K504DRAFT_460134 [Pleomassaria siparia CBS 279.74]|uniref:Uncharacterized protein n=1 Tax=Pleomassaria siparia CBS 279.74 TaxID=1314801 RepID=A0A6G1K0Q6_9PLEO|nr:hypothetical protein K504DRAFT_460134 [Pleomassaria siparia CBS 279.74]